MSESATPRQPRIVVLGVGNILLGDEGVGVHVVRELEKRNLPDNVRAVDGGTGGFSLAGVIAEADRLIVIDTLLTDAEPGAVFTFAPDDVRQPDPAMRTSLHDVGLLDALQLAALQGHTPETTIYGVVPANIGWSTELTPAVAAAVPKVVDAVLQETKQL